jgi:Flp pilus assembly protein TadG
MMVSPVQKMLIRVRGLLNDRSGVAAVEFVMIVPIMLVMFFGVVEFSSGIAVDRKATLVARTLSDLTSQMVSVADADLTSFGQTAKAIMTPYAPPPLQSSITEIYVDITTGVARVQWSKGLTIDTSGNVAIAATPPHNPGDIVVIPPALVVNGTYLIWSEVSYKYTPAVGYVMAKTGITLSDTAYTRPRQVLCVIYPTPSSGSLPSCPQL